MFPGHPIQTQRELCYRNFIYALLLHFTVNCYNRDLAVLRVFFPDAISLMQGWANLSVCWPNKEKSKLSRAIANLIVAVFM